jgi:hypothetical protein
MQEGHNGIYTNRLCSTPQLWLQSRSFTPAAATILYLDYSNLDPYAISGLQPFEHILPIWELQISKIEVLPILISVHLYDILACDLFHGLLLRIALKPLKYRLAKIIYAAKTAI